jgi:hypothetical protein
VQCLFHGRIGLAEPLLQKVNTQRRLDRKRRTPVLPAGACGVINATNSAQGTTLFISSRKTRLRVRLVVSSNPAVASDICFIQI